MSKKTILYLVRHGSTLLNEGNAFRGLSNVGLSDLGKNQAASIHKLLEAKPITASFFY
jgi:broad specificity phosphatase PhoE